MVIARTGPGDQQYRTNVAMVGKPPASLLHRPVPLLAAGLMVPQTSKCGFPGHTDHWHTVDDGSDGASNRLWTTV
ncbi:hypothetical protein P3T18_001951 [Paraburkholderia sp. GAS199]